MRVRAILRFNEGLEEAMSRLYDGLRLRHAQDPESAALFAGLRDEELEHRDIVRHEQRLIFSSPDNDVELLDYDSRALERVLCGVEDPIALIPHLSLREVLWLSVEVELAAAEQRSRSVVGRVNPALGALVRNLGACDWDHIARLEAFATERGIPLAGC